MISTQLFQNETKTKQTNAPEKPCVSCEYYRATTLTMLDGICYYQIAIGKMGINDNPVLEVSEGDTCDFWALATPEIIKKNAQGKIDLQTLRAKYAQAKAENSVPYQMVKALFGED